jgi:hypothetical protein
MFVPERARNPDHACLASIGKSAEKKTTSCDSRCEIAMCSDHGSVGGDDLDIKEVVRYEVA